MFRFFNDDAEAKRHKVFGFYCGFNSMCVPSAGVLSTKDVNL